MEDPQTEPPHPLLSLMWGVRAASGTHWGGFTVVNGTSPCRVLAQSSPISSPAPGRKVTEGKSSSQCSMSGVVAEAGGAKPGTALGAGECVPADSAAGVLLAWALSALPSSSPLAELLPPWGQRKGVLREAQGCLSDFIPIPSSPPHPVVLAPWVPVTVCS